WEGETREVTWGAPPTPAGAWGGIRGGGARGARVGPVAGVFPGEGPAAHPQPAKAEPFPPLTAAKAAIQPSEALGPRLRGDERPRVASPAASTPLDPFFEVRTPERNFGPARVGGNFVTPLARRLASEAGIDLSRITPSGAHGRIVARDVETAAATQPRAGAAMARGPSASEVLALYRDVPFEEVPLDGMRKTIATRLVQAKQTIPHF